MTTPEPDPAAPEEPTHQERMAETPAYDATTAEPEWQRLDPKMLLIGPFDAVRQMAVPAVIALVASGSQNILYSLFALPFVVIAVVLVGFLPWFTTRYRITATQLQRRSGLISTKLVTAPLDRVRSVDLESPLLHRLLSLTKVEVGTGVDDTKIELNSLSVPVANELRRYLLERSRGARTTTGTPSEYDDPRPGDIAAEAGGSEVVGSGAAVPAPGGVPQPVVLAEIDWSWLRFAPFSLARLVIVAGALGALSQFADDLPFLSWGRVESSATWVLDQALALVIAVAAIGCLIAWLIISIGGYVIQWWNLRLFREHGNLRLMAGLFTTRSTTLEEARIRGLRMTEPILLRAVGGAELATLSTGVENGVTPVLPPAPAEVARRVGRDVLESEEPLAASLTGHGPLARRRCHVRNQWPTLILTLAVAIAAILLDWSWWLPALALVLLAALGVLLAEQEYRHLGHGLSTEHLLSGSGTTSRIRTVLERDGIIGWVIKQSLFQRRLGLATLVATTAAGSESVEIRDLPHPLAVELADRATPGMLTEFLAGSAS